MRKAITPKEAKEAKEMLTYMTQAEAALYIRSSKSQLLKDRNNKELGGIPFIRFNGKILYAKEDLDRFMNEKKVIPQQEA